MASKLFAICLIFGFVLHASNLDAQDKKPVSTSTKQKRKTYAIAIHGGAGSSPGRSEKANKARMASLKKALEIGTKILENGGTSLHAVEEVVKFLEDDPQFNAGKGAVFNSQGKFELDASIMSGKDKSCGAVAGVKTIKNPITLARLVMTKTRHVLLATDGAEQFAKNFSEVTIVENSYFQTERSKKAWEQLQQRRELSKRKLKLSHIPQHTGSYRGTVGCVALDSSGNLAAATSTGGLSRKKFGRVGDSPIVGAGTYADNATCAVSCTGTGEQYIRNVVAYDVSARMKYKNVSVQQAVDTILSDVLNKGDGGIIAVDKNGNIHMNFSTRGMARAAADSDGRFEVIWGKMKLGK